MEGVQNPSDNLLVRAVGRVGLETDVGEFRFRSNVDCHVASLKEEKVRVKKTA